LLALTGCRPALGEGVDPRWVTVFGFPPAAASLVVRHFQAYGVVLQHRPGAGNWMHLQCVETGGLGDGERESDECHRFQSPLEAVKALSKDGRIIEGHMIGVKPCVDQVRARPLLRGAGPLTCGAERDGRQRRHGG
jgi:hypothetical protein